MRLALDQAFAESLRGKPAATNVVYLDQGGSGIAIEAGGKRLIVPMANSGRWQVATMELGQSSFEPAADGAHISVGGEGGELTLHMVEVVRAGSK